MKAPRPLSPRLSAALPFWLSLALWPPLMAGAFWGGAWLALPPFCAWGLVSLLDLFAGQNHENPSREAPDQALFWYRFITYLWPFLQIPGLFLLLAFTAPAPALSPFEKGALFFGFGILAGTVGINYAHELMHRQSRWARALADMLLAAVLYSHFRSEHLRVHHPYVGTPRDLVTARYGMGFHRHFLRVLAFGLPSAWRAERLALARKGRGAFHPANPFWRYAALQGAMLAGAFTLAGPWGLALFLWQAFIAIWQLELVNYVEHYGLTRRHLGAGRYEPVAAHHAWNADHRVTNWLLINLQRHADHHLRPDREFPLLQTYAPTEAPRLPQGYPAMTALALIPPLWRRRMNPRVKAWRARHYPDITDWTPYNKGRLPLPPGA